MTNVELFQIITEGSVDVEQLQVVSFDSSNLLQLTDYFGKGYYWSGHFKGVPVLAHFCAKDEIPLSDDWDFCGIGLESNMGDVYCYNLRD